MTEQENPRIFLSHNIADKEYVRRLAAALSAIGARVWFDEWTIRPGDSIPGSIEGGISSFDTFVLVWSEAASKSRWVKTEMEAAFTRWLADESIRLVPVILDKTPLPKLIHSIKYIDGSDCDHVHVARTLLGIDSEIAFRLAVQRFINETGLQFHEFWGVGILVACPNCGATIENIEGVESVDDERDNIYLGARCKACGWSDGSEL